MALKNAFRCPAEQALKRHASILRRFLQSKWRPFGPDDRNKASVGSEDGQSMIELAVTLPAFLALIFCFMELCMIFYSYNMISESAREGTRYAMVHGATCPTSANPTCKVTATQVNTYVSGLGWPNLGGGTITVATLYSDPNEAIGSHVSVQVTYVFPITMPYVPSSSISMSATSQMTIIQ
jgi:Flp pilus assembly protein TadG